MNEEDLEKEWQYELKKFIDFHSQKTKNMTESEEHRYIIENKLDEKIKEMQRKYQKQHDNIKNSSQD